MKRSDTEKNMPSQAVQTAARTAIIMAVLLLCSKIFGFVREMVMAAFFGTSYIVDAYVMAQSIPSMLFAGVFGAIATAYMPLLSEKMENGSPKEGDHFTSRVISILLFISAISAIIGFLFSAQFTAFFAKGFAEETARLTVRYLKVTFAYCIFSSSAGILEAYLQYKGTFIPQVVIGYTQNAILIGTILFCAYTSHEFLAYGLLIAYVLRLFLMYCVSKRKGFQFSLYGNGYKDTFRQIIPLAVPVFIGNCGAQINMFVDKYLASGLVEGSVAALNYGSILNATIMTLSTSVLSTIIYPKLSQANASGSRDSVVAISRIGVGITVMIAAPFSIGAIAYSNEIVQIIFERGAFDEVATALTQGAYRYYSVGMAFMAVNTLLTNLYYSIKDVRKPMAFALTGIIVNILFNLLLIEAMKHEGLALSTSLAAIANTMLLYVGLRKYHDINVVPSWSKLCKILLASVVSVAVSLLCYKGLIIAVWMPRMVYLGIAVCVAIAAYLMLLRLFKIDEMDILLAVAKKRGATK